MRTEDKEDASLEAVGCIEVAKGTAYLMSPIEESLTYTRLFALQHPNDWLQIQKMLANNIFEVHIIRKIVNGGMLQVIKESNNIWSFISPLLLLIFFSHSKLPYYSCTNLG